MNYNKYFPIVEYYKRVIVPLNPVRYRIKSEKMLVCPVHDDHDPSLGIMSNSKKGEFCHCFGCNFWGDVVELHQRVSKRIFKKYLNEEEAIKDLCRIFSIDFDTIPKTVYRKDKSKDVRDEEALNQAMGSFDIGNFSFLIREGKKDKRSIGYFNALTMTMLNEVNANEERS